MGQLFPAQLQACHYPPLILAQNSLFSHLLDLLALFFLTPTFGQEGALGDLQDFLLGIVFLPILEGSKLPLGSFFLSWEAGGDLLTPSSICREIWDTGSVQREFCGVSCGGGTRPWVF